MLAGVPAERPASVVNSVSKSFALLELLCDSDSPMGVTALAHQAELGKSNVHRLLQTLVDLGYVAQLPNAEYAPTIRTWELGSKVVSRLSIRDVARPAMQALADATKEAVHLSLRQGYEVLYIDKIESKEPVRAYTQLGGRGPIHCTATGKAILAFQPADEIAACMAEAVAHNPNTITTARAFNREAGDIRAQLYALNRGEWRADILGIASPIADSSGSVVAAIGLSAPSSRVEPSDFEALAPGLTTHAQSISAALGCTADAWERLRDQD